MGKAIEIRPYGFITCSFSAPRPGLVDKPENYFIMSYKSTEENG
jgi:hypothetical protein